MKGLNLVFLCCLLSACAGGANKAPSNPNPPPAVETPDGTNSLSWGDLQCQKSFTCETQILNFDQKDLVDFLAKHYSVPQNPEGSDMGVYICGVESFRNWMKDFEDQATPDSAYLQDVSDFLDEAIEPKFCVTKENPIMTINNYFKNTKEYKNETQSMD